MIDCEETLSTARGDHRDSATVREHLAGCAACRAAIHEVHEVANAARVALFMAPSPTARLAFERARAAGVTSMWLTRYALAAAATAATIIALIATKPPDRPAATAASSPKPFILEFPPPENDRLQYVVHGPDGSRNDVVEPHRHYVIETVPLNAVVVDTF